MTPDDKASTTHELSGLEPDNLLAFLAMLGLLRALEMVRPEWEPRIAWIERPPSARLHISTGATRQEVVAQAEAGIQRFSPAFAFEQKDLTFTAQEFRGIVQASQGQPERTRVLAALASDGAMKRDGERVESTPLCLLFGQGHQHFLSRLHDVTACSGPENLNELSRALFEPWKYGDATESFRWDSIEDRRYAHQYGNPSDSTNKIGTVAGANRLAALGFTEFTTAPASWGLVTIGVAGRRGDFEVCWPLPNVPTRLAGYRALLAHPHIGDHDKVLSFKAYGVTAIAHARRYQVDKYFNFERADVEYL